MPEAIYSSTEAALESDPRTAPFGVFTSGSFVLDSARVFMWFESVRGAIDGVMVKIWNPS